MPADLAGAALREDAAAQMEAHGFVCGLPTMAIVFWGIMLAVVISFAATAVGVRDLRATVSWRSRGRKLELLVPIVPFVARARRARAASSSLCRHRASRRDFRPRPGSSLRPCRGRGDERSVLRGALPALGKARLARRSAAPTRISPRIIY